MWFAQRRGSQLRLRAGRDSHEAGDAQRSTRFSSVLNKRVACSHLRVLTSPGRRVDGQEPFAQRHAKQKLSQYCGQQIRPEAGDVSALRPLRRFTRKACS